MKCVCGKCNNRASDEVKKWDGKRKAAIMIAGNEGVAVHAATITIEGMPLIVEPWMLEKVLLKASKELTNYIVNYDAGKTVN